jgi:diaminohydroxyphosphoribosylaminopyrimidine deaminase / 5-amino-6-(5-phosphoribosylamino)uracil reductase
MTASSLDEAMMKLAIAEAERARGSTGDNPWVGCVIADAQGQILGRGHTQGPGEDHAEIAAARDAAARGLSIVGATLYSTLEPCSFHGRTPACAHAIVGRGIKRACTGILDPNPRVNGEGIRILRAGGIEVVEDVCAIEVRKQLGPWMFTFHPHEPRERASRLGLSIVREALVPMLAEMYDVDPARAAAIVEEAFSRDAQ